MSTFSSPQESVHLEQFIKVRGLEDETDDSNEGTFGAFDTLSCIPNVYDGFVRRVSENSDNSGACVEHNALLIS